jgi:hypothetical protein
MKRKFHHNSSTLEQLEGGVWSEPLHPTHLVSECHRLRRVPLGELTVENLRMLVGQHIGVQFLMPLALEELNDDPLAEGDCYPGDLLCAVLRIDADFWSRNETARAKVDAAARRALSSLNPQEKTVLRAIREALEEFHRSSHSNPDR